MECKSLRDSGTELSKFDVAFFGASCDQPKDNKTFAEKLELNYPLLSDPDQKAAKAYGIARGRFSNRVTIFVGKDGKIAHIDTKVNVREHGKQVVEKLKELKVAPKAEKKS